MCAASSPEKQMGTYFLEMALQSPPRDLLIALKKITRHAFDGREDRES